MVLNAIPLEECKMVLGKQWIDKRKATFNEVTHILQIFSCGKCY